MYLREAKCRLESDVLGWWRLKSETYPSVSRMARDYLAIPASSASVEREFSDAKLLVTDRRCSLDSETIEAIKLLKSWTADTFDVKRMEDFMTRVHD